jgi:hypothetical protein
MLKGFLAYAIFQKASRMLWFDVLFRSASILLDDLWPRLRLSWATRCFRSRRADYYEYLADLIEATAGTKTLHNVFHDDALRYCSRRARGVLSIVWLDRFPKSGGDLFSTWFGTLPTEDLLAIQSAQYAGSSALTRTFRQLAEIVKLVDQARASLLSTAFVGVVGITMAVGSVFAIPFLTVKHLKKVFSTVPPEYYGDWTRSLFAAGAWLGVSAPYVGGAILIMVIAVLWSFPNWKGATRDVIDQYGPWAFYRRVQAIRFVSLLCVTLSPRACNSSRLRDAVSLQAHGASPWFARHISLMVTHLESGATVTQALDTGLMDEELWWYFTDLFHTLGLDEALKRIRLRIQSYALEKINQQALYLRWLLLFLALAMVLGIAYWHVRVFEELRQSLSLHYAI